MSTVLVRLACDSAEGGCDGRKWVWARVKSVFIDRERKVTCQKCRGYGFLVKRVPEPVEPTPQGC